MKKFALIVAGGSGNRMKSEIPKQFLELNGKPLLMHTIEVFKRYDPNIEIVLVLPQNQHELWESLCKKHQFLSDYKMAFGGDIRFQSVKNGLDLIPNEGIVFIHDGVRPLVSIKTIENCYQMTLEKGNALPVIPVSESVRIVENNKNRILDRSGIMLVQTPQTFMSVLIKKAYQTNNSADFTDDASVLEFMGEIIHLVDGNRENIKITYPEDLIFAASILSRQ